MKNTAHFINFFGYSHLLKNLSDEQQTLLKEDPLISFKVSNEEHMQWMLENKEALEQNEVNIIRLLGDESYQVGKTFT